jgi:hypothetical protein
MVAFCLLVLISYALGFSWSTNMSASKPTSVQLAVGRVSQQQQLQQQQQQQLLQGAEPAKPKDAISVGNSKKSAGSGATDSGKPSPLPAKPLSELPGEQVEPLKPQSVASSGAYRHVTFWRARTALISAQASPALARSERFATC